MKRYTPVSLILLMMSACGVAQQNIFSAEDFAVLYDLIGTWKMETPRGAIYEQWAKPDIYKLSGRSFKLKDLDTLVLERIELTFNSGKIVYSPIVSNQNNHQPVPFQLISSKDKKFVFENKVHDFPQRIIYHIVSVDSVHARIEGTKNGNEMGSDFFYSRMR